MKNKAKVNKQREKWNKYKHFDRKQKTITKKFKRLHQKYYLKSKWIKELRVHVKTNTGSYMKIQKNKSFFITLKFNLTFEI